MNRKNISWMMIIVFTFIIIGSHFVSLKQVSVAAMDKLKWRKNDTLDISMNIVGNKTGIDDILLECDLENAGTYVLDYYLEDFRKTEVIIEQSYDKVDIYYKVLENQGDPLNPVNITQDLLDISYLEVDYSKEVPDWVYDGDKLVDADTDEDLINDSIKFEIPRSASSKYPGVAFNVNNKRVIIKWDFQTDKLYYLLTGYEAGKVMPISYTLPDGSNESLKALKSLEDFNVNPRYLKNNAGTNEEVTPILSPDLDGDGIVDNAGARPALEITFKQPKEIDLDPVTGTWQYGNAGTDFKDITAFFEMSDIASDDYLDFNFELATSANNEINSLPNEDLDNNGTNDNENVTYSYAAGTYTILISKDKRDLANQDTIIQWNDLDGSKIYNVDVNFQVSAGFDDYQFTSYKPINKFAYTYMEYELKRANMQEAYLDIKPYDVGAQDEVEYTILYSKVVKPTLDPQDDLWVKHYHTGEDSSDNIFVPVPFRSTSSQDVYQIIVTFANTEIASQVVNYRANLDTDVPPTTPIIDSIENLKVVPDDDSTDPIKIQFDLTWTAPSNKIVTELDDVFENIDGNPDNDSIYYEVMINDLPNGTVDNPYEIIKVFEVYKDVDDLYKVKLHEDLTGTSEPATANYTHGYNSIKELFRMNNINVFSNSDWTNKITTNIDYDAGTYTPTVTANDADILFPGVNYIKIKSITKKDGVLGESNESIPVSLSLSMIKYEIPLVDNLSYLPLYGASDNNPLGISLYWDSVDINDYENHMLYPMDKEVDSNVDSVIYSVYISEDRDKIDNLDITDVNYKEISMEDNDTVIIDNAGDPGLNNLRNGEVLFFQVPTAKDTNTTLDVDIEGLDKNNNYYVRIVTKLLVNDLVGANDEERFSSPSSMLSTTTPVFPKPPGDDEIYPLAPNNLEATFTDDNRLSATLTWNMPDSMTIEQDTYGFEIVNIENRSLPNDLSSRDTSIEDIISSTSLDNDAIEAWKLYVEGGVIVLKKYNESTDTWDVLDDSLFDTDLLPVITMIDDSNSPNKVNYYYVRSINVEGGITKAASPWASDTLTTTPIKEPINLIVDYSDSYSSNPKSQAIIRFDAPIPDTASIGTEYVIEIYVKSEEDIDYSPTKYPSIYIDEVEGGALGYRRLYYRINGLDSGKRYNIKARIEDRTKELEVIPGGISQYPKSPFSSIVSTRTDFDQEDYDKENKYLEYINYYEEKAKELKKVSYFTIEDTSNKTVVKYRDEYALGEIKRASNKEYSLQVKDKDINIIYLPSNFVEAVNANKVTLKIQTKGQSIGIRPYSLGINITDEINTMIDEINEYYSNIKDYYIKITLESEEYNNKILNKYPSSPILDIRVDIIGSENSEKDIDNIMLSDLEWVIEYNKTNLIDDIEDELDDGIDDNNLIEIVQDVLEEVKEDYLDYAEDCIDDNLITSTSESVSNLDKNMYIALSSNDTEQLNNIYIKNGSNWNKENSNYYSNKYLLDTKQLTSYVLLPKIDRNSPIYNTYSEQEINTIGKYNLTSLFQEYQLITSDYTPSKNQLISTCSRILGANENYDDIDYLIEREIDITNINPYSPVNKDEALNLLIQVFGHKNNIDLNKVNILNYNIIEDMVSIDSKYKKNLIIGANLGIIELENGRINPKQKLSMEDLISILTKIEEGIDW